MIFVAYTGYDVFDFLKSPSSQLNVRKSGTAQLQKETNELRTQLEKAAEFFKTLEFKRRQIRAYGQQLAEMRSTLSEEIDAPMFIKTVVTEAQKVGLTVMKLQPGGAEQKDYYVEQPFVLSFRGVYIQILVLLQRLANMQTVIAVDGIEASPFGPSNAKYVELQGQIQIKAFRYTGTKEDEIASQTAASEQTPPEGAKK